MIRYNGLIYAAVDARLIDNDIKLSRFLFNLLAFSKVLVDLYLEKLNHPLYRNLYQIRVLRFKLQEIETF